MVLEIQTKVDEGREDGLAKSGRPEIECVLLRKFVVFVLNIRYHVLQYIVL